VRALCPQAFAEPSRDNDASADDTNDFFGTTYDVSWRRRQNDLEEP
jgi:hypothetical protein